ncbi:hypothetical protein QN239_32605 [Mycolicibacterium sp. Y3]
MWSPEWLGVTQHITVRRRRTFDSSATPKAGARRHTATTLAPVDVEGLRRQLDAGAQDVQSAPPVVVGRQVQAEIVDLRRQLAAEQVRVAQVQRVEVPVLLPEDLTALTTALAQLHTIGEQICAAAANLERALAAAPPAVTREHDTSPQLERLEPPSLEPVTPATVGEGTGEGRLRLAERQILTVLAQYGQRTTNQVALLTGRSHKGGGFRNALSALRSGGLIEGRGDISITDAGRAALGSWERLPAPARDSSRGGPSSSIKRRA